MTPTDERASATDEMDTVLGALARAAGDTELTIAQSEALAALRDQAAALSRTIAEHRWRTELATALATELDLSGERAHEVVAAIEALREELAIEEATAAEEGWTTTRPRSPEARRSMAPDAIVARLVEWLANEGPAARPADAARRELAGLVLEVERCWDAHTRAGDRVREIDPATTTKLRADELRDRARAARHELRTAQERLWKAEARHVEHLHEAVQPAQAVFCDKERPDWVWCGFTDDTRSTELDRVLLAGLHEAGTL